MAALREDSRDLIWSLDIHGRRTFVNRRATREIYGYEPVRDSSAAALDIRSNSRGTVVVTTLPL